MPDSENAHPLQDLDRVIHAQARLMVMTHLAAVEEADFTFLINLTGLTWGNLSSHLSKLEKAKYIEIEKHFLGKKPHTIVRLTSTGKTAFEEYRKVLSQTLNGNIT